MKKIVRLEGMHCDHCKRRVEETLHSLHAQKVHVDLRAGTAQFEADESLTDDQVQKAIVDAGYEVLSITEKKGLFR